MRFANQINVSLDIRPNVHLGHSQKAKWTSSPIYDPYVFCSNVANLLFRIQFAAFRCETTQRPWIIGQQTKAHCYLLPILQQTFWRVCCSTVVALVLFLHVTRLISDVEKQQRLVVQKNNKDKSCRKPTKQKILVTVVIDYLLGSNLLCFLI